MPRWGELRYTRLPFSLSSRGGARGVDAAGAALVSCRSLKRNGKTNSFAVVLVVCAKCCIASLRNLRSAANDAQARPGFATIGYSTKDNKVAVDEGRSSEERSTCTCTGQQYCSATRSSLTHALHSVTCRKNRQCTVLQGGRFWQSDLDRESCTTWKDERIK